MDNLPLEIIARILMGFFDYEITKLRCLSSTWRFMIDDCHFWLHLLRIIGNTIIEISSIHHARYLYRRSINVRPKILAVINNCTLNLLNRDGIIDVGYHSVEFDDMPIMESLRRSWLFTLTDKVVYRESLNNVTDFRLPIPRCWYTFPQSLPTNTSAHLDGHHLIIDRQCWNLANPQSVVSFDRRKDPMYNKEADPLFHEFYTRFYRTTGIYGGKTIDTFPRTEPRLLNPYVSYYNNQLIEVRYERNSNDRVTYRDGKVWMDDVIKLRTLPQKRGFVLLQGNGCLRVLLVLGDEINFGWAGEVVTNVRDFFLWRENIVYYTRDDRLRMWSGFLPGLTSNNERIVNQILSLIYSLQNVWQASIIVTTKPPPPNANFSQLLVNASNVDIAVVYLDREGNLHDPQSVIKDKDKLARYEIDTIYPLNDSDGPLLMSLVPK